MVGHRNRRRGAVLLQEMLQAGRRPLGVTRDHDPAAGGVGRLHVLGHLVEQVDALRGARLGEALVATPEEIDGVRMIGCCVEARELRHGVTGEQAVPFRRLQVEALGRHGLVIGAAAHAALPAGLAAGVVVVGDQLVPRLEGLSDLMIGRHDCLGAIVEQRLEVIVKQRQPMLHADMALTGRHGLVEDVVAGDVAEQLTIAAAEARDAVLGEQHLAHGQHDDLVARAGRALAHGIERADRLQRVAEQVEAQRLGRAGRKEIDQAAADGELAWLHHGFRAAVSVLAQKFGQPGDVERLALAQHDRRLGIEAARRHPLQRSAGRCQHDARRRARLLGRGEPGEGLEPLRHDIGMRRQAVVGQAIPGREDQHLALGRKEAQPVLLALEALAVARHVQDVLPAGGARQLGQHQRMWQFSGRPATVQRPGFRGDLGKGSLGKQLHCSWGRSDSSSRGFGCSREDRATGGPRPQQRVRPTKTCPKTSRETPGAGGAPACRPRGGFRPAPRPSRRYRCRPPRAGVRTDRVRRHRT